MQLINRSNNFAEECVRWERLFEDYQFARNKKKLEEERKLGFLIRHVYDDIRTPWHSTMNHCDLTNMTYDQTIQMLHHACQTTPESMQTVKMCNVSKESTTASQAMAKSTPPPSTPHPSQFQNSIAVIIKAINAEEVTVDTYMRLIQLSTVQSQHSQ